MASRKPHPMLDLAAWAEANGDPRLLVADGPSVTVTVNDAMLVVKDGPKTSPRVRKYARAPRTIKHMVIFSAHGFLSMDAMAWLYECEITWSVIDRSGERPRILATSGRYVNPVNERRQAMCGQGMPAANTGVKIFRYLLTLKLEGQADNAERILHDDVTAKEIRERINHLAVAKDISRLMGHEGQAADVYWQAWKDLPVMWNGKQPSQPHWLRYPSRRTLRRDWESNRNATDPINAMLNFGYHCAEVECILACYAAALSPAMGIGHVDDPTRASFALDLIEVMRPEVDRIILGIMCEMLDTRTFRELTGVKMGGVVQVQAPLTHRIQAEVHTAAIAITKALFTVTKMLDSPQSRRAGIKDDSD